MSDNITKLSQNLRNNATPWENKLWYEYLKSYPVRIHRQKVIGHYIVDFYCAKAKLAIELDGGGHYTTEKMQHDLQRTDNLNNHGIKVIRFTNFDVDKNFYEVCTVIDNEIKERMKTE